jgi:hypothetical protein
MASSAEKSTLNPESDNTGFSHVLSKKLKASSRTRQACDRCKVTQFPHTSHFCINTEPSLLTSASPDPKNSMRLHG